METEPSSRGATSRCGKKIWVAEPYALLSRFGTVRGSTAPKVPERDGFNAYDGKFVEFIIL